MVSYKIELEITDILGDKKCSRGHMIGEAFSYPEDVGSYALLL